MSEVPPSQHTASPVHDVLMSHSRQRPLAAIFVLAMLAMVAVILIINTWHRHNEYTAQQSQLVRSSLNGIADQIVLSINGLRKSVRLFGERESALLKQIVATSSNADAHDQLTELVKQDFPEAFAVTLANAKGEPYVTDFDGFILEVCRKDISSYAADHVAPKLYIHPNSHAYHFDIMVRLDLGLPEQAIFFISFHPEMLVNILASAALYQHDVSLVNHERTGLVEVTAKGSRGALNETQFFLAKEQINDIAYSVPVNGTRWDLIDIPAPDVNADYLNTLWLELGIELAVLMAVSLVMLRILSRSENTVLQQNMHLLQQSSNQLLVNESAERERNSALELLERMSNAYIELDHYWIITGFNRKAEEFFEHKREDLIGYNLWDSFPEAVGMFYKKLNKAMTFSQDIHFEGYYVPLRKWIDLHAYPKQDGLVLFFDDITERKNRDISIRENESRMRAIFDSTNEGIISINEDSIIESFNHAAEQIFGFHGEEVIGQPLAVILPEAHKQMHAGYVKKYLHSGEKHVIGTTVEIEGVRKNGDTFPMELSIGETMLDGKRIFTGIVQDITQRKQAEKKANAALLAKNDAESASRAKSAFLANMSHEIRTPLTAIIGFGETLLQSDQTMSERLDAVMTIIRSGHHLLNLINDILDISKIEAGKLEVETALVNPFYLLNDVVHIIKPQALDKGLSFDVNYHFPLPVTVSSDFLRLKQILLNLCSNAIKFTAKGHILINVDSDIDQQRMTFEVIDTGIGLTESEQDKIFNAFTQADSSTTRRFGGTGLGLSLSQQLAQLLGGEIQVESERGVGSKFILAITTGAIDRSNLLYSETQLPMVQDTRDFVGDEQLMKGHVLLAEDNNANQRLISLMLKKMGVTVDVADNGEEAVKKALQGNYDLVFMDMQMPVMDGVEAVTILKKNGYRVPVIALTANAMQEDRDKCFKAGCVDFVTKPIGREVLFGAVSNYLEKSDNHSFDEEPILSTLLEEDAEFIDLVQKFINELPNYRDKVDGFLAEENWQELRAVIHQIKGTAGSYGYQVITEQAAKVEFQVINKNYHEVAILVNQLHNLIKRAITGFVQSNENVHYLTNK